MQRREHGVEVSGRQHVGEVGHHLKAIHAKTNGETTLHNKSKETEAFQVTFTIKVVKQKQNNNKK